MPERQPRDFKGNPVTKDTYTGDLVFHNGAWITKRQRKSAVRDKKEARAYRAQINAQEAARLVPPVPKPPATAPILTGTVTGDPKPSNVPVPATTPNPQVPSWWINAAIQNPQTDDQRFANAANALLPTLSPEDQRTLASYLAQNFKSTYGGYANAQFGEAPTEMTAEIRKSFLNPERAATAVNLLDRMKAAAGGGDMGAGYDYLQNAVKLMNQFASGGAMTREKFQQFQAAVSALGKNATGSLAPYGNLAQLFNLPSFTAGPLVSNTPNDRLFT